MLIPSRPISCLFSSRLGGPPATGRMTVPERQMHRSPAIAPSPAVTHLCRRVDGLDSCPLRVVACVSLVPEASPSSARQVSSAFGRAGDDPDAAAACYPNNLIFSSYDKPKLVKCPESEGRSYRHRDVLSAREGLQPQQDLVQDGFSDEYRNEGRGR
jgi:hypothetical protein